MYQEVISIAKKSKCHQELSKLANHPSSLVRRSVARNSATPLEILLRLSYDPVMNVSYMAVNHPDNYLVQREFDEAHPCVSCLKDELTMHCQNCPNLNAYWAS